MPKTITVGNSRYSGITITYTKSARRIDISGWYDSFVGIEGASYSLGEFLSLLGIAKADIKKEMGME